MVHKVRKGSDLILKVTIDGSTFHTFDDVKNMLALAYIDVKSPNHTPTITSTNQCCNQKIPTYVLELKSLVTTYSANTVVVEILFPADLQTVGGVYCFQLLWKEKTGELIANDLLLTYNVMLGDNVLFVEDIENADSSNNKLNFTFTFTK